MRRAGPCLCANELQHLHFPHRPPPFLPVAHSKSHLPSLQNTFICSLTQFWGAFLLAATLNTTTCSSLSPPYGSTSRSLPSQPKRVCIRRFKEVVASPQPPPSVCDPSAVSPALLGSTFSLMLSQRRPLRYGWLDFPIFSCRSSLSSSSFARRQVRDGRLARISLR